MPPNPSTIRKTSRQQSLPRAKTTTSRLAGILTPIRACGHGDSRADAEPRYKRSRQSPAGPGRLLVLSYRVTLDVPLKLALFVSRLLAEHRREIGTRDGARALTCFRQAVFILVLFEHKMIS